jgi:hypothetical protein
VLKITTDHFSNILSERLPSWSLVTRKKVLVRGYGVLVRGYGVLVKGYGVLVRGYGVLVRGYGVLVKGYGVLVRGYGVLVKGYGVLVRGYGVHFASCSHQFSCQNSKSEKPVGSAKSDSTEIPAIIGTAIAYSRHYAD